MYCIVNFFLVVCVNSRVLFAIKKKKNSSLLSNKGVISPPDRRHPAQSSYVRICIVYFDACKHGRPVKRWFCLFGHLVVVLLKE